MKIILLSLFAALVLTACEAPGKSVAIACQGYASTLGSLAVAKQRGQLSDSDIALVDNLRPGLNAVCIDGDYSNPLASQAAVEAAMRQLILIEGRTQ